MRRCAPLIVLAACNGLDRYSGGPGPVTPGQADTDSADETDLDSLDSEIPEADSEDPDDSSDASVDTDTEEPGDTDEIEIPEDDPCPAGVVCVGAFPFSHSGTTTGATSDTFDAYGCAPSTDESGPEIVYRVDIPQDGFLAVDLPSVESGADIDVHLLASYDSSDCLDRGHWRSGGFVRAGRYWVVADTWVTSGGDVQDGSFSLTLGLTTIADLESDGMTADAAEDALIAFDNAWDWGETDRFEYAVTDFSLHSSEKRQWVLDLGAGAVLWRLYVAHGDGSSDPADSGYAIEFSNVNNSHQSSLGLMRAAETYTGTYGYSMRLDGLEPGYNDAVRTRAIVTHPWTGSRDTYVASWGEVAPTWGCPGIDDRISDDVIDTLSDGALMLFWYPDGDWSASSDYLQ